jgi:YfiH family protein
MQPTRIKDLTSGSCGQATGPGSASLALDDCAVAAWPSAVARASVPASPLALDDCVVTAWPGRKVWHGFLGRRGGVSRGPYESLNFSYLAGDAPAAVATNWRRLQACFPPGTEFVQVHQVHGNRVHRVDAQSRGVTAVADGMVSAAPGVILGILTADCVPVLLYDGAAQVVGALHAGWRGVIGDIASAGISAMAAIGANPGRIEAALGPAIGACCFEVDLDLADRFVAEIPEAARHVRRAGAQKAFIDLKGLLREQLTRAGLQSAAITDVPICTRCSSDRFFSRRAAGAAITGLQLSFIGLPE